MSIEDLSSEILAAVAKAGFLLARRLAELTRSHHELEALETAGVDNSDAYGEVRWARVVKGTDAAIREIGLLDARMLGLSVEDGIRHADTFVVNYGSSMAEDES